jgi:hypothetical protein
MIWKKANQSANQREIYCFDVLMQIYQSQGYSSEKAVRSIIENNL